MPVDKFGRMSDSKTRDTGVSLTYINNNYIRSDGGTPVTGSIDMGGNTLRNVAEPVNPHDVATKEYADNKRTHVIAINSHYTGPLHKDTFQFSFGGYQPPDRDGRTPGFLVPHSGRIVKLKMKTPISAWRLRDYFNINNKADVSAFMSGLFKIYNFKHDEQSLPEEIGIFTCKDIFELIHKEGGKGSYYNFCFDDDLPIFNPEVKEGDVINIMTMVDLEFPIVEHAKIPSEFWGSDYNRKFNLPVWFNVFLVSVLIELDPL